ncbi:MAG: hypothetical protein AAF604_01870 [Acidobacteriota bacterium]
MSEWNAAFEAVIAERRARLGDAPPVEVLIGFLEGRLSEEERAELLDRAAVDPQLSRLLLDLQRFPDFEPLSDEEFLSESRRGELWQDFRGRIFTATSKASGGLWQGRWPSLAASFLIGAVAALFIGQLGPSGPTTPPPSVLGVQANTPIVELLPEGHSRTRGDSSTVFPEYASGVTLALAGSELLPGARYGLKVTGEDSRAIEVAEELVADSAGVVTVVLPREILKGREFWLDLSHGVTGRVVRYRLTLLPLESVGG